MTVELAIALAILSGGVLMPFAFRLLGSAGPRNRVYRIFLQYIFAFLFALFIAGGTIPDISAWPIAVVGFIVASGVFFQWRANAWSLSRSSVFVALVHVIPLTLSGFLLGEWRVFENTPLLIGFVLAACGIALHAWREYHAKKKREAENVPLAFYAYALAFTLIFGIAVFLENTWAKTGVPTETFIVTWYFGTLCGAGVLFALSRMLPREPRTMSLPRETGLVLLAACAIVLSLWSHFVVFQSIEQVATLPIFAVAEIVGYTLIGMLIFKEWKTMRKTGFVYLGIGVVGALLIVLAL